MTVDLSLPSDDEQVPAEGQGISVPEDGCLAWTSDGLVLTLKVSSSHG